VAGSAKVSNKIMNLCLNQACN